MALLVARPVLGPVLSLSRPLPNLARADSPTAPTRAAELDDLISVPPNSSLDELDYAFRNYILFASTFMGPSPCLSSLCCAAR